MWNKEKGMLFSTMAILMKDNGKIMLFKDTDVICLTKMITVTKDYLKNGKKMEKEN